MCVGAWRVHVCMGCFECAGPDCRNFAILIRRCPMLRKPELLAHARAQSMTAQKYCANALNLQAGRFCDSFANEGCIASKVRRTWQDLCMLMLLPASSSFSSPHLAHVAGACRPGNLSVCVCLCLCWGLCVCRPVLTNLFSVRCSVQVRQLG
jgi:hypothetical protein